MHFVFFLLFLVCTGLVSGLDFFSFAFCSLVSSVLTCFTLVTTLSLGFCWSFLFWNYTRYMWVNFVPSWNLCGNAVQWCYHLCTGISFTPPFLGESSPRKLYTGKKNCVREMEVEVRFLSGCPVCYLWNSSDFPYNRSGCNVDPIPLEYAASS